MKLYSKPNLIVLGREVNENILSNCKSWTAHAEWNISYCQCQYKDAVTGKIDCNIPCKIYALS